MHFVGQPPGKPGKANERKLKWLINKVKVAANSSKAARTRIAIANRASRVAPTGNRVAAARTTAIGSNSSRTIPIGASRVLTAIGTGRTNSAKRFSL